MELRVPRNLYASSIELSRVGEFSSDSCIGSESEIKGEDKRRHCGTSNGESAEPGQTMRGDWHVQFLIEEPALDGLNLDLAREKGYAHLEVVLEEVPAG